ncbi:hypothetical protein ISF_01693 [Cordyceps fumosorosea ARSEF 2679]|uniref:Uncharacterized protein n=1 Tax=Cordyceps fumosorosea (strain ARSEF 2679) TaxID=1081104 RepID=A0A162JMN0_CORFA|nr:hypothetical protein ISF_01693 [Cordyceps fumosorosea ARSEF 2679]OAA71142.1 hypothetical protein ISF_01693 [Cordyceps fumosorosea ARSEF 2679]
MSFVVPRTETASPTAESATYTYTIRSDLPSYATANLGPLTTTFTPKQGCDSLTASTAWDNTKSVFIRFDYAKTCDGSSTRVATDCLPPLFASAASALGVAARAPNPVPRILPVYSPGTICPTGYWPACGVSRQADFLIAEGLGTGKTGQFNAETTGGLLKAGQAATGCCRSGFTCDPNNQYGCKSSATSGDVITANATACGTVLGTYTSNATFSLFATGPCIILVNDLPSSKTAASSSSSNSAATSNSSPASSSSSTNSGDLSVGAKAAIGVCVPLFSVFAFLGIFTLLRRRRRQAASQTGSAVEGEEGGAAAAGGDWAYTPELEGTDPRHPRQSLMMGSDASGRVVSQLSDGSARLSHFISGLDGAPELHSSMPRLHQEIVELPAEEAAATEARQRRVYT